MYTEARIQGIVPETVYLYFHIGGCVVVFVYLNIVRDKGCVFVFVYLNIVKDKSAGLSQKLREC